MERAALQPDLGQRGKDGPPAEMEAVYYDASDCVKLALSVTESFLYRTEQAAADGDTVIFRMGPFEFGAVCAKVRSCVFSMTPRERSGK